MKAILRYVLILSLLAVTSGIAFAANGDTLNIGGQVPLTLDLTVTADASADNLTLVGTTSGFNPTIAAISITTNNNAGWELWVFSTNADGSGTSMNNGDATPSEIAYTIEYSGTGGGASAAITTAGLKVGENTATAPVATPETGDLSITYDQSQTYPAGYYSDQLTIVLRAK